LLGLQGQTHVAPCQTFEFSLYLKISFAGGSRA
jgi:hypothetical protein